LATSVSSSTIEAQVGAPPCAPMVEVPTEVDARIPAGSLPVPAPLSVARSISVPIEP
jgi:hypothetical protein